MSSVGRIPWSGENESIVIPKRNGRRGPGNLCDWRVGISNRIRYEGSIEARSKRWNELLEEIPTSSTLMAYTNPTLLAAFPSKTFADTCNQKDLNETVDATVSPLLPIEDTDDTCGVCGQDGRLLLCDFPGCSAVYHQLCVLRTLSEPLIMHTEMPPPRPCSSSSGAVSNNEFEEASERTWYCPRHQCVGCHRLEYSEAISSLPYPLPPSFYDLVSHQLNENSTEETKSFSSLKVNFINPEELRSCSSCPLSVCIQCEGKSTIPYFLHNLGTTSVQSVTPAASQVESTSRDMGMADLPSPTVSRQTSTASQTRGVKGQACICCITNNVHLRLARLLEGICIRAFTSRLAVPFLHPLLPLHHDKETSIDSVEVVVDSPSDLLDIIEKIHRLEYSAADQLLNDLSLLRSRLMVRLQAQNPSSTALSVVIQSFDTLIDHIISLLKSQHDNISQAETCISLHLSSSSLELPQSQQNDVEEDSENPVLSPLAKPADDIDEVSSGTRRKRSRQVITARMLEVAAESLLSAQRNSGLENSLKHWRASIHGFKDRKTSHKVTARPLVEWVNFLSAGSLPLSCYDDPNGTMLQPAPLSKSRKRHATDEVARQVVSNLLQDHVTPTVLREAIEDSTTTELLKNLVNNTSLELFRTMKHRRHAPLTCHVTATCDELLPKFETPDLASVLASMEKLPTADMTFDELSAIMTSINSTEPSYLLDGQSDTLRGLTGQWMGTPVDEQSLQILDSLQKVTDRLLITQERLRQSYLSSIAPISIANDIKGSIPISEYTREELELIKNLREENTRLRREITLRDAIYNDQCEHLHAQSKLSTQQDAFLRQFNE